jgi:AcrR family transcriptional regulator
MPRKLTTQSTPAARKSTPAAPKSAPAARESAPAARESTAAPAGPTREPINGSRGSGRAGLRRRLVEREILERAAELFAQRGFAGTTVQDIADALGMSRPALYYYVKSKEVILEQLVENLSINDAKVLEGIRRRRSGDPVEKLREMAQHLANNASSNPYQTQILSQSKHHLPEHIAQRDREAERSIVGSLIWVLELGMRRGQFRALDPHTAALAIIGMCLWTAWWVQSSPPETLTAQVADQAVASVLAFEGDRELAEPADLLRAARANLDRLQSALDG